MSEAMKEVTISQAQLCRVINAMDDAQKLIVSLSSSTRQLDKARQIRMLIKQIKRKTLLVSVDNRVS